MIVNLPPAGATAVVEAVSSCPGSLAKPVRDLKVQQDAADLLVTGRCPICRAPLVARMTCQGPKFLCLCAEGRHRNGVVKAPQS
jgi:hypothetical protein